MRRIRPWAAIRLRGRLEMGLLLGAGLGIGWCCGAPDVAIRKALAATAATRIVAAGPVIATGLFAGMLAVIAVVAYGLVSIVGAPGSAFLFGRFNAVESRRSPVGS
jgi:BASS family bile acid:Na+ symporter